MYINDNWRITSDELNVILQQRRVYDKGKNAGEEYWSNEGYYSTPHGALKALVNKQALGTGLTDLQAVCDKIDELHRMIDGLNIDVRRGMDG